MTAEERVNAMLLRWLPPPHQGMLDMPAQWREIVGVVRAAESAMRERCARVADHQRGIEDEKCLDVPHTEVCTTIAEAIRALG